MRGRLHKIIILTGAVIGTSGELWAIGMCKTEPMGLIQSIKEEAGDPQHSTSPKQREIKLEECTPGDYQDSKPIIETEMDCINHQNVPQSIKEEAVDAQHSTLHKQPEIKLEEYMDYHDSKPITIKTEMDCESECNQQDESNSNIVLDNPIIDTYLQAMADSPSKPNQLKRKRKSGHNVSTQSKRTKTQNLLDEANFATQCEDYSLFTDKVFLKFFENNKTSITKSTYYLIFSQFFAYKRHNKMSIETAKRHWKCLDELFVLKKESNGLSEELLELYYCVVMSSRKLSRKSLRELLEKVNRSKISNILPDQSFFEQDIKSPTTDSEELFETISQALAILTSDIAKDIIMTNIKKLYQGDERITQSVLYFESIYTLLGDRQFIIGLKSSFKALEAKLGDSVLVYKLKKQLHNMRMDLFALFKKCIIPYLDDQSVDKVNAIQGLFTTKEKFAKTTKSHTISTDIGRIFTKWAKDNQHSTEFESLKYLGHVYLNIAYQAYHTVIILIRILSGKVGASQRYFKSNKSLEYIIWAQFNPDRIRSFLSEYQNK